MAAMNREMLLSKQKMSQAFKLFDQVNESLSFDPYKLLGVEWRRFHHIAGISDCYGWCRT